MNNCSKRKLGRRNGKERRYEKWKGKDIIFPSIFGSEKLPIVPKT